MTGRAKIDDAGLMVLWEELRSPTLIAQRAGMSMRAIQQRLRDLGVSAMPPGNLTQRNLAPATFIRRASQRLEMQIETGRAVIFSDAHFRADAVSTANRALVKLLPELKPKLLVCNGDALDGDRISRHASIYLSERQTVGQELRACTERLDEIAKAAKGAKRVFTLGNHDIRLWAYVTSQAPELLDIEGLDLQHLFPAWQIAWSLWINGDTVVKHRWKSSQWAPALHVKGSLGMNFVTGHLHSLKVLPLSAYSHQATRYGVDCGTLADPAWPSFSYREDAPADWRSGFVVLTWHKGRLLWPEVVAVLEEDYIEFRGSVIKV
jgi:hypothetical protein